MADTEPTKEYPGLEQLFKALGARLTGIETAQRESRVEVRDGLEELRREQQETNVHLATLNGTVSELQRRASSHSGKLADHAGVISELVTNQRVIMETTRLRDAHQEQDIRDARSGAWEARLAAGDARTEAVEQVRGIRTEAVGWAREVRQAAISAVLVVALLVMVLALAGVFG